MKPYPKYMQVKKPRGRVDWKDFGAPKEGKIELKGKAYTDLKKRVFKRDGNCCVICGAHDRLTLGHIVRRSKLRMDTEENTTCQCAECNGAQEAGYLCVEWNGTSPARVWSRNNPEHEWRQVR